MKISTIALAFAVCTATLSAHAANSVGTDASSHATAAAMQWTPATATPHGKTRAEVREELAQAQMDGELDRIHQLYHSAH